ncbi:ead/Ea22-like family protein [Escherichia coli]|nr:ead/Ea22-like family protein [Escherichia coli]
MSKIDYQALRDAAVKAGKDKWQAKKINGDFFVIRHGSYTRQHGYTSYQPIAGIDCKPVRDFVAKANPATVLALLDERERNQQYIKRRDQENEDIALTVGKLRVELEAAENNLIDSECHVAELEEALRDKQALLEASEKRIAELEAELVSQTYKLNELSGNSPVTPDGWISCSERMPNDAQWCVVNTEYGYYVQCWSEGQGWLGDDISIPECDVINWMPLPEPPQEVKRG